MFSVNGSNSNGPAGQNFLFFLFLIISTAMQKSKFVPPVLPTNHPSPVPPGTFTPEASAAATRAPKVSRQGTSSLINNAGGGSKIKKMSQNLRNCSGHYVPQSAPQFGTAGAQTSEVFSLPKDNFNILQCKLTMNNMLIIEIKYF